MSLTEALQEAASIIYGEGLPMEGCELSVTEARDREESALRHLVFGAEEVSDE